jgi:methylated-DNA-[protein]-cysteine S-methyltransferase
MTLTEVETPVGLLTLVGGDTGLRAVLWPGGPTPHDAEPGPHAVLAETERQLREYFEGTRRTFELPLELVGTPFQRRAWLALANIPYATTVSYGEQARRLGVPRAARAIGAANGRNPLSIVLPCHRVVGAGGALTGYGGGLDAKRRLLDHELRVGG